MSDTYSDSTLCSDQFYAQAILTQITAFVEKFKEKGELNALRNVIEQRRELQGGIVGQMPERFTKDELISPMLDDLGYQNITAEPADLVHDQHTIPDFRVEGVDETCVCIAEAKRLGRVPELDAEQTEVELEVEKYLNENALTKYKRDLDVRYLVGIGTDGIVWILYGKDLETGTQTAVHAVSLRETFKQAVLEQQHDSDNNDENDERWNVTHRSILKEKFVPRFVSNRIADRVASKLTSE